MSWSASLMIWIFIKKTHQTRVIMTAELQTMFMPSSDQPKALQLPLRHLSLTPFISLPLYLSLITSLMDDGEPQWPSRPSDGHHWHQADSTSFPPLLSSSSLSLSPFSSSIHLFVFVSVHAGPVQYGP